MRPSTDEDMPFILQTWMHSFRKGSDWARRMYVGVYRDFHRQVMTRILTRPTTRVWVAGSPDDDITLYGYLVTEHGVARRDVVHYVYVKEPFRRLGICKTLVTASGINPLRVYFTHLTRDRIDNNASSPTAGQVRWRGAETLLRKWPEARAERDPLTKKPKFTDGNIWVPYLV